MKKFYDGLTFSFQILNNNVSCNFRVTSFDKKYGARANSGQPLLPYYCYLFCKYTHVCLSYHKSFIAAKSR